VRAAPDDEGKQRSGYILEKTQNSPRIVPPLTASARVFSFTFGVRDGPRLAP
jgi:hypothetical protein